MERVDRPRRVNPMKLERVGEVVWELGKNARADMNVPVRVIADDVLIEQIRSDKSLEQLVNVATLPGVTRVAVGMPDMHEGYGFPVGGVAATKLPDGVISPGGIGFDINCGVRLLATPLRAREIAKLDAVRPRARCAASPRATDAKAASRSRMPSSITCSWKAAHGSCESTGSDAKQTSRASNRAARSTAPMHRRFRSARNSAAATSSATLGGGNHFLEVQVVSKVFDESVAKALGLFEGQMTVLVHTGSRGLGHQVCTDYVRIMDAALARHHIVLPDRQLACAPLSSREGRDYFAAMCAAANFAFCNRQALTARIRSVFDRIVSAGTGEHIDVVYDVAHNVAKIESYGRDALCVHRKGATRAFGPSSPELPERYRKTGQPVLHSGKHGHRVVRPRRAPTMRKNDRSRAACHGAGRAMSRGAAKRRVTGAALRRELEARGIVIRCPSNAELAEEAPLAYKDVERVASVVVRAGIARFVAKLEPLGVVKG